jgi:hypothetical protein
LVFILIFDVLWAGWDFLIYSVAFERFHEIKQREQPALDTEILLFMQSVDVKVRVKVAALGI